MDIIFIEFLTWTPHQYTGKLKCNILSLQRKGEIFAINNRIVAPTQSETSSRTPRRTSLVPAILADSSQNRTENIELTSSPPRAKQYAACSKQSKRNLKRLTH